jgi:hypothetical protein
MKQFLIRYRQTEGSTEDWHREIGKFIAAIDDDPALRGKIGYRCLKARDGADYFHIATVHEESGRLALQERPFFRHYTELTRRISGGTVEVLPVETVAQTAD